MRALVLVLLSLLVCKGALAQVYPSGTVEIVLPYSPGGTGDLMARQLAKKLGERFGRPFVVLHKPGAAGTIGASVVAKAKPDGHTLLLGYTSEIAVTPSLVATSYTINDFEPIALAGVTPFVLLGRKGLPAKSMAELIQLIKTKPGGFAYASAGIGSPAQILAELFKRDAALNLVHVPYKSGPQVVTDLLGEHVDLYFAGTPNAIGPMGGDRLKAFAVTDKQRAKVLPDVPTMEEAGFQNFNFLGWFALFAPKGTPPHVLDQLREASRMALGERDLQAIFADGGVEVRQLSAADLKEFITSESAKYKKLVSELSITANR